MRLTGLQDPAVWKASGRWDDEVCDVWFKTKMKNDTELGLGPTHEEPITNALKPFITSYRDLPKMAYQIQTKFRNELRAKSGVMRGREFVMKDLYTFSRDEAEHNVQYDIIKEAYGRVYDRLGIGADTYLTFASGGMFAKYSHEFQTICDAGEDIIYVHEAKRIAINQEVLNDEVLADLGLSRADLVEKKAAEVGNIFTLGEKFSAPIGMTYAAEDGTIKNVFMGSYGIGPTRLVGVITELLGDDKGLVWPKNIAPYAAQIVVLGVEPEVVVLADKLYADLAAAGVDTLYDDRDERAGQKFADADLMGMPYRVVVSKKTIESGLYEVKVRATGEEMHVDLASLQNLLAKGQIPV
jgi:prolyl-tRNA synthetase